MSAHPPSPAGDSPIGPIADDASIHLLADTVLDAVVDDVLPPSIVRFRRLGADIEFGTYPLDGAHPSTYLVGYRPDDDCFALGVAAHGWAYHVSDRARRDADRTRVCLVSIVSRSGEHAHRTQADAADHPLNDVVDQAPSGEQVDLLRRAFGLATDPPPCGTNTYWSIEWLATVADAATHHAGALDWSAVMRLHPAATLLSTGGIDPGEHDFVDMVTSFARVCDWPRIRALVDAGGYRAAGLRRGDGEWFDDGSLARYLLSRCPPLATLRDDIGDLVSADAHRRTERILTAVGVPDAVWPDLGFSAA